MAVKIFKLSLSSLKCAGFFVAMQVYIVYLHLLHFWKTTIIILPVFTLWIFARSLLRHDVWVRLCQNAYVGKRAKTITHKGLISSRWLDVIYLLLYCIRNYVSNLLQKFSCKYYVTQITMVEDPHSAMSHAP